MDSGIPRIGPHGVTGVQVAEIGFCVLWHVRSKMAYGVGRTRDRSDCDRLDGHRRVALVAQEAEGGEEAVTPQGWANAVVGGVLVLLTVGGVVVAGLPWWGALLVAVFGIAFNGLILRAGDRRR